MMTAQTVQQHPLEAHYSIFCHGVDYDRDFVKRWVIDNLNEKMAVSEFSHQWLNSLEIVDNSDRKASHVNANQLIKIIFDVAWVTNPDDDSTIISANNALLPDDTDFSRLDYYFYKTTFFATAEKQVFKKIYQFARTLSKKGFLSLIDNETGEITETTSEPNLVLHFGSKKAGV